MGILTIKNFFSAAILLFACITVIQPVMAENATFIISYRGSGWGYIGDTIIFDGFNPVGNATLLKITGPGLSSEGLPVYNLNGLPGTGTMIETPPDGKWKFVWYTSNIQGIEKLQTARYTLIASDSKDAGKTATTSVMLKKPDFYITATPDPSFPGDYVQLTGKAENGISSAKIEITDASGNVLHSFTSPVSESGSLSFSFHVDMEPGKYFVTVTNPSLKTPYRTSMSVVAWNTSSPASSSAPVPATSPVPGSEQASAALPASASGNTSASAAMEPATLVAGVIISGAIIISLSRK
jgi:hypothetical protein